MSNCNTTVVFQRNTVVPGVEVPLQLTTGTCATEYVATRRGYIYNPQTLIRANDFFFSLAGSNLQTFVKNKLVATRPITNIAGTPVAIDFRPSNNQLYLLTNSNAGARLYILDVSNNCVVTALQVGGGFLRDALNQTLFLNGVISIDFNPVADRLRIVTTTNQNWRVNVDTGIVIVDGTLNYPADPMAVPNIRAIAYTNVNVNTVLYGIDATTRNLTTINPPNAGDINVVGNLAVNFSEVRGFDIQGANVAVALLVVNGLPRLYNINLATGVATLRDTLQTSCFPNAAATDIAYVPISSIEGVAIRLLRNGQEVYNSSDVPNGCICIPVNQFDVLTASLITTNNTVVPAYVFGRLSFNL